MADSDSARADSLKPSHTKSVCVICMTLQYLGLQGFFIYIYIYCCYHWLEVEFHVLCTEKALWLNLIKTTTCIRARLKDLNKTIEGELSGIEGPGMGDSSTVIQRAHWELGSWSDRHFVHFTWTQKQLTHTSFLFLHSHL